MTSKQDILNRIKSTQFAESKGEINPDSDLFIKSTNNAIAEMFVDVYSNISEKIDQTFSSTVTTKYYADKISIRDTDGEIKQKGATKATGSVVVVSNVQTDILSGTNFISGDQTYSSLITRSCVNQLFAISASRDSSGLVTCIAAAHPLATNMSVNITGLDVGVFEIIVLDKNTFTYKSSSNVVASGSGTCSFNGCIVDVVSIEASAAANKTNVDSIDLGITNNDVTFVGITYDGIFGGSDQETLESYILRLQEANSKPQNKGNPFQHSSWIKNNSTANFAYFFAEETFTQILVKGVIGKYDENYDFSEFTSAELASIRQDFIDNNQLGFLTVDDNLTFQNPVMVGLNITLSGLYPNTLEMKTAIQKELKQYLAKLPIKFYLTSSLSEISNAKIEKVASNARDSNGNTPIFTSVNVQNATDLNTNVKKPILGTITY